MKCRVPVNRCEDVLSEKEKAQIEREIRKQFAEADKEHNADLDAMILYTLHSKYGWGAKRLRDFYDAFRAEHRRLQEHYEMKDGCYVARQALLQDAGVDVLKWNEESMQTDSIE